jgi:hypothetical protein
MNHLLTEYQTKDSQTNTIIHRAECMCNMAIECIDHATFNRYQAIIYRLIEHRRQLLSRYKEALMYGGV